ncbi:MAG TPA: hypothetical protein VFC90_00500 [Planctomycetota bacterium]|nr:hypothetical protein [Planctomycetota bacterium]
MSSLFLIAAILVLQDPTPNPADQQKKPSQEQEYVQSYEVVGKRISEYQEEDRIGGYEQPRWTATRRFPTTRVYVVPEGKMEAEWWMRTTFPKDGGPAEVRYLWELEMGLPYRFQLDLYLGMDAEGSQGTFDFTRQQVEVRWALADWGRIWANPTLYVEYINKVDESDAAEFKLLFGDELSAGWHWGVNGVFERELHDDLTNEWQFTAGLSRTITDMKFSVGGELQVIWEDTVHTRGHYEQSIFLGPSIQWHPQGRTTVNVALLAGIGPESPDGRTFLNVGWEF